MRSSDWMPIETAPLNPYGKAWGPTILVWCTAVPGPVAAYFEPLGSDNDNGPRWVCVDDGRELRLEDASHWMPIAAPLGTEQVRNTNVAADVAEPPETE